MIDIILLILFLLISLNLGRKIMNKASFSTDLYGEEQLFSIGVGMGSLSLIVFFLGIAGILFNWVILSALVLVTVTTIPELKKCFRLPPELGHRFLKLLKENTLISKVLVAVLIAFVLINLIGALAPVRGFDPQTYHLLTPKKYLMHHRIYSVPDSSQSYYPMAIEMLYVIALSIGRPVLAKLIHFSMGLLIVLSVIMFSKKYLKNGLQIGILTACMFYSQPVIERLSTMAKTDLGSTYYFVLAVMAFVNWVFSKERKWVLLSAVFIGFTASAKFTGILMFPMLFAGVFFISYFQRKKIIVDCIFQALMYSVIGFIIVSPWYTRTYLWTGDPFYPYLSNILSGSSAAPENAHSITLLQYVRLPWDLTFNIGRFLYGNIQASPYYLAFLPLLFAVKKRDRIINWLIFVSVVYISFFFFTDITMRYILPALTLLSIVYAYSILKVVENTSGLLRGSLVFIMIASFFPAIGLSWECNSFKIPVVMGMQSKEVYLAGQIKGVYDVSAYSNRNLPKESKIFSPWEVRGYYFDREFYTGNSKFGKLFAGCETSEELIGKLVKLEFTHILMNKEYHKKLINMYAKKQIKINPKENPFYKLNLNDYLEYVYSKDNVYLYEIKIREFQ